jgi:uncharacterized protein (TIGR03435 family)
MRPIASLTLLVSAAAIAQNANPRPQFEVASIRPTEPGPETWQKIGVHIDGAMVRCVALSLRDYVGMAYNVKTAQISGPAWLGDAKFDVSAKLPDGATRVQLPEMMQALLAERFKLEFHRESKELPVYALTPGKGPLKLKESAPDAEAPAPTGNVDVTVRGANNGSVVSLGGGSSITSTRGTVEGKRVTIRQLLDSIERYLDHPAVDMTGLNGVYDVTIQYSLDELRNVLRTSGSSVTIPDAAADQFPGSIPRSFEALGLKLEARKAPLDILVIDRMEKMPTQN